MWPRSRRQAMIEVNRRSFLSTSAAAAAAAACAPAASPAQPSASGGQSTATGWEKQWEDLVAAAKKEGTLVLVTTVGGGYKDAIKEFEGAFPGINVDLTSLQASAFAPKALQERQSGLYTYDAITTTYGTVPLTMVPAG